MSQICSFRLRQYVEPKKASSSALGLFELIGSGGGAAAVAPLIAFAVPPVVPWERRATSRNRSFADGVRMASAGRPFTATPLASKSSMSLALITGFMLRGQLIGDARFPNEQHPRFPPPSGRGNSFSSFDLERGH